MDDKFKFGEYSYEKTKKNQFLRRDRKGRIKTITHTQFYEVLREVNTIETLRKRKENNEPEFETEAKKIKIELENFLTSVNKNKLLIDEKYDNLFEKYSQYAADSAYKVLAGQFQRMYVQYGILYKKVSEFYKKVEKNKQVTIKHREERIVLLGNLDALGIKYIALFDRASSQEKIIEDKKELLKIKEQEKEEKIYQKSQEKQRKEHIKAGKQYEKERARQTKELEREKKLDSKNSDKNKKQQEIRREDIQSRWDERKENRIQKSKQEKIDFLRGRQQKVNNFFDMSRSPVAAFGRKAGGFVGGALGGIANTLGIDYSEEAKILSGLFSPVKALGGLAFSGIKSLTQNALGVSDNDIQQKTEDISNSKTNKISSNQSNHPKNTFSSIKNIGKSFIGGAKNLFSNTKNIAGAKNLFSNTNNKQSNQNNNSVSNLSNNHGDKFENTDFNRSDDKDNLIDTHPIVGLLEKILKELKKQTDKKNGLFGSATGSLMKNLSKAIPAVAAFGIGYKIGTDIHEIMDVNETINESHTNTKEVIQKKLKEKNASKKDIDRVGLLLDLEQFDRDNLDNPDVKKSYDGFVKERNEIMKKYLINRDNKVTNNSTDSTKENISNFRNESSKSTIKAELNKIEKIKDVKDNPDERMQSFQKWLSDVFIPKLADTISNNLISNKSAGKSVMPAVDPF